MGVSMATGENSFARKTSVEPLPRLFGEVLREFRREHGISVSSLSETSGITNSALFRIEIKDPTRTPNRSTIASLFLSLSFLSGKTLDEVYRYFLERISDPKQVKQIGEGMEVARRMVKISKGAGLSEKSEVSSEDNEGPKDRLFGGEK